VGVLDAGGGGTLDSDDDTTSDGSTSDGSSDSGGGWSLPGWITDLRVLVPFAGTLAAFARDPQGFILNRVLTAVVGLVLEATAFVVATLDEVWSLVAGIPSLVFSPIFSAGDLVASGFELGLLAINEAIVGVASLLGPAAPFVVVLVWAFLGIAVTWLINQLLTVIKWI